MSNLGILLELGQLDEIYGEEIWDTLVETYIEEGAEKAYKELVEEMKDRQ